MESTNTQPTEEMAKLLEGLSTTGMGLLAFAQQLEVLLGVIPEALKVSRVVGENLLAIRSMLSAQETAAKVDQARQAGAPEQHRKDVQ